jgi:hypothetical protein
MISSGFTSRPMASASGFDVSTGEKMTSPRSAAHRMTTDISSNAVLAWSGCPRRRKNQPAPVPNSSANAVASSGARKAPIASAVRSKK